MCCSLLGLMGRSGRTRVGMLSLLVISKRRRKIAGIVGALSYEEA
jgi:hypothetical protein